MLIEITPVQEFDVEPSIASLVRAFDADPLMHYFFGAADLPRTAAVAQFFSQLMQVRLALGAPVLQACVDGAIAGLVMGYGVSRPDWPPEKVRHWDAWVQSMPGLDARFRAYDAVSEQFTPAENHHYLGVIGVDPLWHGKGVGRHLLEAYCGLAADDSRSRGVYLETTNPASLAFYERNGFCVVGKGDLDGTSLWCVYRTVR